MFQTEVFEMKKAKSGKNLNKKSKNIVFEDDHPSLEFCEVCFIAFGSQEQRIFKDRKVTHVECCK